MAGLVRISVALACSLLLILAGGRLTADVSAAPGAPYTNGALCNESSVDIIFVAAEKDRNGKEWFRLKSIRPGGCTDWWSMDVEAVYGKVCSSNGQCYLQIYKIGFGTIRTVNGPLTKQAPGRIVYLVGNTAGSSWLSSKPADWPWPNLSDIRYTLNR